MKRPLTLLLFSVTVLVAVVIFCFWLWMPRDASPLPAASEVESMTAQRIGYSPEIMPSHILPPAIKPPGDELPDFQVPQAHIATILDAFKPARAINFEKEGYAAWAFVGKLTLKCKSGRSLDIHIYFTHAEQPGAFGVYGIDPGDETWGKYRAGSTQQTLRALMDAYIASRLQ